MLEVSAALSRALLLSIVPSSGAYNQRINAPLSTGRSTDARSVRGLTSRYKKLESEEVVSAHPMSHPHLHTPQAHAVAFQQPYFATNHDQPPYASAHYAQRVFFPSSGVDSTPSTPVSWHPSNPTSTPTHPPRTPIAHRPPLLHGAAWNPSFAVQHVAPDYFAHSHIPQHSMPPPPVPTPASGSRGSTAPRPAKRQRRTGPPSPPTSGTSTQQRSTSLRMAAEPAAVGVGPPGPSGRAARASQPHAEAVPSLSQPQHKPGRTDHATDVWYFVIPAHTDSTERPPGYTVSGEDLRPQASPDVPKSQRMLCRFCWYVFALALSRLACNTELCPGRRRSRFGAPGRPHVTRLRVYGSISSMSMASSGGHLL
jgi:hypothetical protein